MMFKSYSDHTEPIFCDLNILNLYKLNEYLTSLFVFRYFHLHNLPDIYKVISLTISLTGQYLPKSQNRQFYKKCSHLVNRK